MADEWLGLLLEGLCLMSHAQKRLFYICLNVSKCDQLLRFDTCLTFCHLSRLVWYASLPVCSFKQQWLTCCISSFTVAFVWLDHFSLFFFLPKNLTLISTQCSSSSGCFVVSMGEKKAVPNFCKAHERDEESNQCAIASMRVLRRRRMRALQGRRRSLRE